jgi:hypothetical protein
MFRDLHGWRFGRIAIALTVIVVGWYLLVVLVDWLFDSPQVFDVVVGGMWVLLFFAWVPAEVVLLTLWAGKGSRRRATLATAAERPGARPVAPAVPAEGDASPLVRSPAVASDIPVGADGRRPGAGYGIAAAALVLAAIALPYLMDMVGSLRGTQDPSVPEVFGLLLALLFLPLAATVLVLILLWAQKRNADHRPRRDDLFRDARGVRFGVIAYLCALVFFALPYVFLIVTELQRGVIAPDLIPSVDVFVQVWNVVFFIWLAIEVVLVLAWLVKRSKHRPPQAGLSPAHSERCRHCLGEGCWYCPSQHNRSSTRGHLNRPRKRRRHMCPLLKLQTSLSWSRLRRPTAPHWQPWSSASWPPSGSGSPWWGRLSRAPQ